MHITQINPPMAVLSSDYLHGGPVVSHSLHPARTSSLTENNFLIRMLFKDITFTYAFSQ